MTGLNLTVRAAKRGVLFVVPAGNEDDIRMKLERNENASSTKQDAMEFCGLPLIGQKRPMNGAQLGPLRVAKRFGKKPGSRRITVISSYAYCRRRPKSSMGAGRPNK